MPHSLGAYDSDAASIEKRKKLLHPESAADFADAVRCPLQFAKAIAPIREGLQRGASPLD
jgi:hypothetical protein